MVHYVVSIDFWQYKVEVDYGLAIFVHCCICE